MIEHIRQKTKQAREEFVSKRAMMERDIDTFIANIGKVDHKLIAHIQLPEGILSTKTLLPSLYEERVDVDKYNQELEKFKTIVVQFDAVRDSLIKEAEAMINAR